MPQGRKRDRRDPDGLQGHRCLHGRPEGPDGSGPYPQAGDLRPGLNESGTWTHASLPERRSIVQAVEQKAIPSACLLLEVMPAMHCKQKHDMTAMFASESSKEGCGFTSPNSNQDLLI